MTQSSPSEASPTLTRPPGGGGPAAAPTRNAVCLCADRNMLIPALFVAAAAKARSSGPGGYDVLLFIEPGELTDAHRRWIEARGIALFEGLDPSRLDGAEVRERRLSKATLSRLLIPEQVAGRYDRVLYLDADVSVHDEIAPIFALDTGPFALAAAPAGRINEGLTLEARTTRDEHFRALGMTAPYRYINSGVLYIDVAKWNRAEIGARAVDFVRRNPDLCMLPDEDALNAVLDGAQAELSPLWNMRWLAWSQPEMRAIASPVVIHYDGPVKPWKRFIDGRPLGAQRDAWRLYQAFLRDTPWPDWLATQWTARDLADNLAFEARLRVRRMLGGQTPGAPHGAPRRAFAEAMRRQSLAFRYADVEQGVVTREGGRLRLRHREPAA